MVFDLNNIQSHPNKPLLTHIEGVRRNVKLLTNSKLAELVAIFHDLGKVNPNFQAKLNPSIKGCGYANHAYMSAYIFFCVFAGSVENKKKLRSFLEWSNELTDNDIIAICVLIAKHHGNLPDFEPKDYEGTGRTILSKDENEKLYGFLNNIELPVNEYVNSFFEVDEFMQFIKNPQVQQMYLEKFSFKEDINKLPLDFFLDFQFAFASVIQADKVDAANFDNFIETQRNDVTSFSNDFKLQLDNYLSNLNQDSELNKLRTEIRVEAVSNLAKNIKKNRVFELTAPTGSGKTLMLLSLASEIIDKTGSKRIIYGLPFLSITEQVEAEVLIIFQGKEKYIQRIDSKSENQQFEKLQKELDGNPDEKIIEELNLLEFQENTFAYPFVITTFVRFFETLLSNRNSELLKLPSFSNCIFLLDEIQSLPPRLYSFFIAYITKFCEKFNSYAIISTATQPNFSLPKGNKEAENFFFDYRKPFPLLPLTYFERDLFNRYQIDIKKNTITLSELKEKILATNSSALVILNTIDDTKELYKLLEDKLCNNELILLNTHFTPQHRKLKIYLAKRRLRENKRIIVISTQLIEAGVDIDFPVLFRDFATVASIVQSAGRCNRNGKLETKGNVYLFKLKNKNKERFKLIYRGLDEDLPRFTQDAFDKKTSNSCEEKELLSVQQEFFNRIQSEWHFAKHWKKNNNNIRKPDWDFLKDISQCMYDKIGKFQLIDKLEFGEEYQYFVPRNENDKKFEILLQKHLELINLIRNKEDISLLNKKKKDIGIHLKKMSNQIVQIRVISNAQSQYLRGSDECYYSLYKMNKNNYSFIKGIELKEENCII
ncbi:MAG: CRISPR-associated helicase Cas3' [Prevotella sp.]